MIHAHISEKRAVPWWAAIGAPLVGVPVLVALLALASPDAAPAPESLVGSSTERIEAQAVDHAVESPVDVIEGRT